MIFFISFSDLLKAAHKWKKQGYTRYERRFLLLGMLRANELLMMKNAP